MHLYQFESLPFLIRLVIKRYKKRKGFKAMKHLRVRLA